MKVMMVAGGTGGHIYPALALADILVEKEKDSEVVFFGSNDRLEAKIIPEKGYRFIGTDMESTSGGILNKIRSVLSLIKAEQFARNMLIQEKPDLCIGFGNYISVPLIRAAHKLHIPTLLHEQNSFAGKANMYLGKMVDGVVGCYPSNLKQFPEGKVHLLGNPQASIASHVNYDPLILKQYDLDPLKPFVLVMMGSLGSASVSKAIDEACPYLSDTYQVIIVAGKSNNYQFTITGKNNIRVVDYVDGKVMLKGCALAVLRAGATTMAEIGAIGCASILIPSPYVPNNHQYYNAKELSDRGAAVLLEEKDMNAQSLSKLINELMADEPRRERMKVASQETGKTDAAEKMIALCREISHAGTV